MERTLEQMRRTARISRSEAARALSITESAYWRKEHGHRQLRADEILTLASLFQVSVEEIVLAAQQCAETAQATCVSTPKEVLPGA